MKANSASKSALRKEQLSDHEKLLLPLLERLRDQELLFRKRKTLDHLPSGQGGWLSKIDNFKTLIPSEKIRKFAEVLADVGLFKRVHWDVLLETIQEIRKKARIAVAKDTLKILEEMQAPTLDEKIKALGEKIRRM